MKTKVILLLLAAFSINCLSQIKYGRSSNLGSGSNGLGNSNNFLSLRAGNSGKWVKTAKKNDIKGSVYLFDNWDNKGEIYSNEGEGYRIKNLNFNIELNRIEAKLEDKGEQLVYAFDLGSIKTAYINGKQIEKKDLKEKKGEVFLEKIKLKGDLDLYKLYTLTIKEATFNPMTQSKMGKDEYIKEETYFLQEKDGELEKIKIKKSSILKRFTDKKKKLKLFIKKHNINIKDEEDLIRLLNHYNSLS